MVTELKSDREVGLAYMKSYEIEQYIRSEEKAESLLQLLTKYRAVPDDERNRILSEKNLDVLNAWYEDALSKNAQYLEAKSRAKSILLLLEDFGEIPEDLQKRILCETDLEILDFWLHNVRRAETLDDFVKKRLCKRQKILVSALIPDNGCEYKPGCFFYSRKPHLLP